MRNNTDVLKFHTAVSDEASCTDPDALCVSEEVLEEGLRRKEYIGV